jgi:hypothetical protein
MNLKVSILFLFFASIISCNYKKKFYDNLCIGNEKVNVDTVSRTMTLYTLLNSRYLNLHPLSVPTDTFFVRIEYSIRDSLKIFQYSLFNNEEKFKIYKFPVLERSGIILFDKNKDNIDKFTTSYSSRLYGKGFFNEFMKSKIFEMPNLQHDKSYLISAIPKSHLFEFSCKCKYGLVQYDDLKNNVDKVSGVKNILDFLEYLNKEFGF